MKNFINKVSNSLPYFILAGLVGSLFIFLYKNDPSYDHFVGIIQILIWPAIVLIALLFFKKVFTYLFFSMEEFNFFGLRGGLKNITEVIEDRVQKRIQDEKNDSERSLKVEEISKELENTRKSKISREKKFVETLRLADKLLKDYNELSLQYLETKKELIHIKQFQTIRNRAKSSALGRMARNRNIYEVDEMSQDDVDAVADQYLENQADIKRGK